jgi:hypothetical protein
MGRLTIHVDIAALTRKGASDGLNLVADRVKAVATPRTPMELGDLRSSLTVHSATEGDLESAVTSDSPYAVPQHERLDYRHHRGQAKYLESAAIDTGRSEVAQLMATAARRAMG